MTETVLEWLAIYGLPVYFATMLITAVGIPFPVMIVLIIAGAFVDEGRLELWQVIAAGTVGTVIGDNIGYAIGKYGSRRWIDRLTARLGDKAAKADDFARKWGAMSIFLSRWLITPLSPWINITSGMTGYSWPKFLFWDFLGKLVWVVLYVTLGMLFSEHVQEIGELAGDLTWVIVGIAAAAIMGWVFLKHKREDALHVSKANG